MEQIRKRSWFGDGLYYIALKKTVWILVFGYCNPNTHDANKHLKKYEPLGECF